MPTTARQTLQELRAFALGPGERVGRSRGVVLEAMVPGKRLEAQTEIPAVEVYRNDDGAIVICQEESSSGFCEEQFITLDDGRALRLAIALVETVKGT